MNICTKFHDNLQLWRYLILNQLLQHHGSTTEKSQDITKLTYTECLCKLLCQFIQMLRYFASWQKTNLLLQIKSHHQHLQDSLSRDNDMNVCRMKKHQTTNNIQIFQCGAKWSAKLTSCSLQNEQKSNGRISSEALVVICALQG